MHVAELLIVKGLAGGLLVVAVSLLSAAVSPKRFVGLFGAAPAVAIAGLTITLLSKGPQEAHKDGVGMLAGAGGMIVYALVAIPLLRRMRATYAALAALGAWVAVAALLAIPVLVA